MEYMKQSVDRASTSEMKARAIGQFTKQGEHIQGWEKTALIADTSIFLEEGGLSERTRKK